MKEMKKKLTFLIPLFLMAVLTAVFMIYAGIYYRADPAAEAALRSDDAVQISRTDYGWFFDGPSGGSALIFYPGGKVEETAYAPLCHALAREGMDVCIVKMPFRLAVFGGNRAEKVMESHVYEHWFIGGHSLGGVMAASFASEHGDALEGLVLLAAYSIDELDEDLRTVLIYGSEDRVLDYEKARENRDNLPKDLAEYVIMGGNHAQFGSYGRQKGDGEATISAERQWDETVSVILGFASSDE